MHVERIDKFVHFILQELTNKCIFKLSLYGQNYNFYEEGGNILPDYNRMHGMRKQQCPQH